MRICTETATEIYHAVLHQTRLVCLAILHTVWLNSLTVFVAPPLQVARLRQAIEAGGLFPRLPPSRRSTRGGSTADFVSAQGDNTESDDDFFDPQ